MTNRAALAEDDDALNVLVLEKEDGERYIFLYEDNRCDDMRRTLGRFASDKELSFSWYDAAVLSQKIHALED